MEIQKGDLPKVYKNVFQSSKPSKSLHKVVDKFVPSQSSQTHPTKKELISKLFSSDVEKTRSMSIHWQVKIDKNDSIAFVDEENKSVVLVGSDNIKSVDIFTGKTNWVSNISVSSNVSKAQNGLYYAFEGKDGDEEDVGKLVAIDPKSGKVRESAFSFRKPHFLGVYNGKVYVKAEVPKGKRKRAFDFFNKVVSLGINKDWDSPYAPMVLQLNLNTLEVENKWEVSSGFTVIDEKRGVLYTLGSQDGFQCEYLPCYLSAYDLGSNFKEKWVAKLPEDAKFPPLLLKDGDVVVSTSREMICLDHKNGEKRWIYDFPVGHVVKSVALSWNKDKIYCNFRDKSSRRNSPIYSLQVHKLQSVDVQSGKAKRVCSLYESTSLHPSSDGLIYTFDYQGFVVVDPAKGSSDYVVKSREDEMVVLEAEPVKSGDVFLHCFSG